MSFIDQESKFFSNLETIIELIKQTRPAKERRRPF